MGMNMRQNLIDVYKALNSNENLLRLLYYKPTNYSDDPLSTSKPNILTMPEIQKWEIIEDRIIPGIKIDDLETSPKCRILIFMGDRDSIHVNDSFSQQNVTVDIFVHSSFDNIDFRLCWVVDTVNELLFKEDITGMSKIKFKSGRTFNAPTGYVGYRINFEFTDFQ